MFHIFNKLILSTCCSKLLSQFVDLFNSDVTTVACIFFFATI